MDITVDYRPRWNTEIMSKLIIPVPFIFYFPVPNYSVMKTQFHLVQDHCDQWENSFSVPTEYVGSFLYAKIKCTWRRHWPSSSTPVTPNSVLPVSVLISAVSQQNTDIETRRNAMIWNSVLDLLSDLVAWHIASECSDSPETSCNVSKIVDWPFPWPFL